MSRFFIHTKTLSYPTRLHKSTGSPEPSLITFVINTSRYGFIMLGSSDSKKKTLGHIYDTERPERLNDHRHVGHCVHARVVVYMYLIFVMTGQNISAICISPTFIELSVYHWIKVWWMHAHKRHWQSHWQAKRSCSADMFVNWRARRKTKAS